MVISIIALALALPSAIWATIQIVHYLKKVLARKCGDLRQKHKRNENGGKPC